MVHHKRLVFILALAFILMGAIAVTVIFWQDPVSSEVVFTKSQQKVEKAVLGKPCTYDIPYGAVDTGLKREDISDGLQCYFSDYSFDEQKGLGTWVKTDPASAAAPKKTFRSSLTWKTYTNTEYGFTFDYPSDSKVGEMTTGGPIWQGRLFRLDDPSETHFTVQVNYKDKDENNAYDNTIKPAASMIKTESFTNLGGLSGTVKKIFYKSNLYGPTLAYSLNLSDKYELWVSYDYGKGTDYDYINDSIIQSLKAIK